jgi:phosphoribosylformylglycinamidine synthase subunit PurL
VALGEACLAGRVGCTVTLPGDPFTLLFSESAARAVVAVTPGAEQAFAALCARSGLPAFVIGVTGGESLRVNDAFDIPLSELAQVHRAPLPALFG